MQTVNLDGLSEEETKILAQLADALRASHGKREAQAELGRLLDKLASRPNAVTEQEADALALEAVALARSRSS